MAKLLKSLGDIFTSKKEPASPFNVAAVSSVLGSLVGTGLTLAAVSWPRPGTSAFGLYISCLGVFHLSEFLVTAKYNPKDLTMSSFLLTNGPEYAGAQAAAVIEAICGLVFGQPLRWSKLLRNVGLLMVICGQFLRTRAMAQAAQSFSHLVALKKKEDHVLVTNGIYSWVRHPSYAAYLLWAVGSQVMLCNPICTILFTGVLHGFFKRRIETEEEYLVKFFGDDYVQYRNKVWSGVPFVR